MRKPTLGVTLLSLHMVVLDHRTRPDDSNQSRLRKVRDARSSCVPDRLVRVKPAGVVCDGYRVIFMSGQAPSAGMVGWVGTSSVALAVSVTGRRRQRASTSRPR